MTVTEILKLLLIRARKYEAGLPNIPSFEPSVSDYLEDLVRASVEPQDYFTPARNKYKWQEVLRLSKGYRGLFDGLGATNQDRAAFKRFITTEDLVNVQSRTLKSGEVVHTKDCECQICRASKK